MIKIDNYSYQGEKTGQITLPKELEVEGNLPLLSQAVRVYFARNHTGLASTKTRAEVNKTKKKLYKQKGTGGARHGSKRAPIFVGGGVAGGPRPVERELNLPEKMRRKALGVVMSLKAKSGEVVAVSDLARIVKTKEAGKLLEKIGGSRFSVFLSNENAAAARSFRNLKELTVGRFQDLNAWDIFNGGKIVLDSAALSGKQLAVSEKRATKIAVKKVAKKSARKETK